MNGWNERTLLRHWRKLHVKTWQLVLLVLVLAAMSVYFLRQNNLEMVRLRNEVITADQQGGNVAAALEVLNAHVFSHMNTTIVRPIELVHTYNKQAQAAIEVANQGSGRDIYAEATRACEKRGIPLTSVAQCAADYAAANNPSVGQGAIVLPDKNRFIYTFATPRWTPDVAGFLVIATGVILLWLLVRVVEQVMVRLVIRRRIKKSF